MLNWIRSNPKWAGYALLCVLAMAMAVFLTGCSTSSAEGKIVPDLSSLVPKSPVLPDPPSRLARCWRHDASATQATNADELVTQQMEQRRMQEACLKQWPEWYRSVQAANGVTPGENSHERN